MWAGCFGVCFNNEGIEYFWGVVDYDIEVNYIGLDGLEV